MGIDAAPRVGAAAGHGPRPALIKKKRKSKSRLGGAMSNATTQRRLQPLRHASHPERLSYIMAIETSASQKLKRGQDYPSDDGDDKYSRIGRPGASKTVSQELPMTEAPSDPDFMHGVVGAADNVSSSTISHRPKTAKKPKFVAKRTAKKPRLGRNKTFKGLQEQIAKKRRSNDDSSTPVDADAMTPSLVASASQQNSGKLAAQEQSAVVLPEPTADDFITQKARTGHKRRRAHSTLSQDSHLDMSTLQSTQDVSSHPRVIAALPTSKSRKSKGERPLPIPVPVPDRRTPRTPEDMDGIIRSAAAEALMLSSTADEPGSAEWEQDQEVEEDSSDDEDDLPLHLQVSNTKHDAGRAPDQLARKAASVVDDLAYSPHAQLPKAPLPGYPPIWAQVNLFILSVSPSSHVLPSPDKRCANHSTGSEVIKAVSILPITW